MKTTGEGYLFRRGNVWCVRFGVGGKRIVQSLGTTDKAEAVQRRAVASAAVRAQVAAVSWQDRLASTLAKIGGQAVAPMAAPVAAVAAPVAVATQAAAAGKPRAAAGLAFADAWTAYLASQKRPASSDATLDSYERVYNRFAAWAAAKGLETLHAVDAATAEMYAKHIDTIRDASDADAFELSSGTVFKHLSFLRTLYRCLVGSPTPFDGLRSQRHDETDSARDLSAKECKAILADAPADLRAFLVVSALSGARLCDVVGLTAADLVDCVAVFTPAKTRKKGIKVEVPLPASVVAKLPKAGPLFPAALAAYERQPQDFSKAVASYMREHAADDARGSVSHRSFRHTAETVLGQGKVSQVLVNTLLGHSVKKLGSFSGYRHLTTSELAAAVALLAKHYGVK